MLRILSEYAMGGGGEGRGGERRGGGGREHVIMYTHQSSGA